MKFIKLAIISIVVLFGLLTAFTSLLPSEVRISRAIDIHAEPLSVRNYLSDMETWQEWNEYVKSLSNKQVSSGEINSTELKVEMSEAGENTITTQWTQSSGKTFPGVFKIIPMDSVTTVQWYFDIRVKWYPWEKLGSIIYDKQIGPAMQTSLTNLKTALE